METGKAAIINFRSIARMLQCPLSARRLCTRRVLLLSENKNASVNVYFYASKVAVRTL